MERTHVVADRLGTLLRRLRKQSGLTQEQLAERSGVSVSTIRRLETGRSADHRVGTVNLLADALKAGPEDRRRLAAVLAKEETEPALESISESPSTSSPLPSRLSSQFAGAAGELAEEIRSRWQLEEERRRVHDPYPLPVRWHQAPTDLMDHPENIQRLPPGTAPSPMDLDSDLPHVAEVYGRVPSGRMVFLGRAGSGKSILTIRFVLDLLADPAPLKRVPVIFSLGSWDPTATVLHDWLTDRLLRDHPHLVQRVPSGATLAAALLDAGLILPVLDGFDEIAEALRPTALAALNTTSLPLVLTSRRREYAEAVRAAGTPLTWAAGVELADLTPGDLTDYLPRTSRPVTARGSSRDRDANVWDLVLETLRTQDTVASRNLTRVLNTPLMVVLARTIYSETSGTSPKELLNTTRFPTEHALEEHLLASFVPTVYRRTPVRAVSGGHGRRDDHDPDRVQYWLGYLAHHMARLEDLDQRDLAWWRIGDALRRSTRIIAVVLTCTLSVTVPLWLIAVIALGLGSGDSAAGIGTVILEGALFGPAAGLAFGSVYWLMSRFGTTAFTPAHVRLRLPGVRRTRARVGGRPMRTFTSRFGPVLLGGSVMGAGFALAVALEHALVKGTPLTSGTVIEGTLVNMLAFGLIFGSATALVFGLIAALETPLDIATAATPAGLLAVNRQAVGRQVLVLVPALTLTIALGGHLVTGLLRNILGPLNWTPSAGLFIGAVGGLGGAFSYALAFTAWGQWIVLTRVWLPLTGELPWNTAAFLDDAYRRGVLRQTGAVYQFRHSRLQHHLADSFRRHHRGYTPAKFTAPPPTHPGGAAHRADAVRKREDGAVTQTDTT
ncbi:XRE family transcriptional regulator [Streptomyces uncialis]|uniref:XRE family transcriptional regulator n=1 Tax=Streptomyces uncialis TaxID=1048205 RepID=UPI00379E04BF